MENALIGDVVSISPSYTSEVNIALDFDNAEMNEEKVRGYIPTAPARKAIAKIVEGLNPVSSQRVHLITGMYGTGKSHFGLLLANLFGRPSGDALLEPFMTKLRNKDPEVANTLRRNRLAAAQKFLVVIITPTADRGGFNRALLWGLQNALRRERIEFRPQTHFADAATVIEQWSNDTDMIARFERELQKYHTDVRRLLANLRELKLDSYELFCEAYEKIVHMPFHPENVGDPLKVYPETAKFLRSSGEFAGIFVIADEFGGYLTEMARDSDSRESMAVQNFLEFCKHRREEQIHCLVIAHKTLADYAVGYRTQADWEKVSGRFLGAEHTLNMIGGDVEIVDMFESVINARQDSPESKRLWGTISSKLGAAGDWVRDIGLFPGANRDWIERCLVGGCYPLHPATTFCLPWLAQRAGQSNRTAFKFLESRDAGGLLEFMGENRVFEGDVLQEYMPDRLIEYFGSGANEKAEYRGIMLARDAGLASCGAQPLAVRIINLVAVLAIVGQPALPPTRATLVALLAKSAAEIPEVERTIDTLTQQFVLRLRATGHYELVRRGAGEIDITAAIQTIKESRREVFSLTEAFAERVSLSPLPATSYEERYGAPRIALRQFVSPRHLENLESYRERIQSWYSAKRGAKEADALMLYVVAESESDIEAARARLTGGTGSDQLVLAVPKQPFLGGELVRDLAAIQQIRDAGYKVSDGIVEKEDVDRAEADKTRQIDQLADSFLSADNFTWFHHRNVTTVQKNCEEEFLSNVFFRVFDKTPIVRDEALVGYLSGRDTQKKYRQRAMQQLLEVDGPIQLLKSGGQPHERMMRAALRDTGLLEKQKDLGKAEEYGLREIAPDRSPLAEVWSVLRDAVTAPDTPVPMAPIISKLMAPPYGMAPQLIELLLAAVLRTVKDQSIILGNHSRVIRNGRPEDYQPIAPLAENITTIVSKPEDYVLFYYEVMPSQREYLNGLIAMMDPHSKSTDPGGLWERARNAVVGWFARLPLATRQAADLSPQALALAHLLADCDKRDARRLMASDIPASLGISTSGVWSPQTTEQIRGALLPVYEELENHIQHTAISAIGQLCEAFGTQGRTPSDLDESARKWYSELAEYRRLHMFTGEAGALMRAISETGDIIAKYLVKLPQGMHFPAYSEWVESNTARAFVLQVQVAKNQIETWMPASPESPPAPPDDIDARRRVIKQQLSLLLSRSGLPVGVQIGLVQELLAELNA